MRRRAALAALTSALAVVAVAVGTALAQPVAAGRASLGASSTSDVPPAPAREPGVAPPLEQPFSVADGVVRRTLAFGPAGLQQTVDVYGPAGGPQPRPTVLLVHGGAWQIGDSTEWAAEAVSLVRELGWTAVAVNYRLAPAARWPAAYEDAAAALRLLHARADELGVDRSRIGAIGDSAGGQLAALLGEPAPGRPALRSVVTWSGVNDLASLVLQPSAGGCAPGTSCALTGLAQRVVTDLMDCAPAECALDYREGSPAALVTPGHAATLALSSEGEQVDPRQAWVMDGALGRSRVPSRVHVLPGSLHARGYQSTAWPLSLRFLAATLTPETSPEYPRPAVRTTLDLPVTSYARVGRAVPLTGSLTPRALGSSVSLQVRQRDGSWRTARTAPLRSGTTATTYGTSWTPAAPGPVVWRALWRGGGGLHATTPRTVVVR